MVFKTKTKNDSNISASVSEGHLVLSLPTAIEPVIWRKSLEKIGDALFEVKSKDDEFHLNLKKTKSSSETIASFSDKEEALSALNAASNALLSPKDKKVKISNSNTKQKEPAANDNRSEAKKWLIAVGAALLVVGLYIYLTSLIPDTTVGVGIPTAGSQAVANPPESTGVPVSADDFLSSFQ
ncbi:MAG: hypothetical protein AAF549_03710 [Pseudomonadota bacterium]